MENKREETKGESRIMKEDDNSTGRTENSKRKIARCVIQEFIKMKGFQCKKCKDS